MRVASRQALLAGFVLVALLGAGGCRSSAEETGGVQTTVSTAEIPGSTGGTNGGGSGATTPNSAGEISDP
jgi:hypothetical protein